MSDGAILYDPEEALTMAFQLIRDTMGKGSQHCHLTQWGSTKVSRDIFDSNRLSIERLLHTHTHTLEKCNRLLYCTSKI